MTHDAEAIVLPTKLQGIDATFLTRALSRRHPGTEVSSAVIADLRQGSASSLRVRLEYRSNPHDLPSSMFMKGDFIDHDFSSAAAFAGEARYYEHLAHSLDDAVVQPHAYFAGIDAGGQAIVLLEDLSRRGVVFGDCESPLDTDTVADGVRQLAAIQGRYWSGEGLDQHSDIVDISTVSDLMLFLVQPEHFDDYINRDRADFLSAPLRDRSKIERALRAMFESDSHLPKAFVHGDAHLGNTFREKSGRLGFCDFQGIGLGPYIWDVTYFVTGSLTPADRQAAERDLLALYLEELRSHGVTDAPTLETAFTAHRRHIMHGYLSILTPVEMQPDRFAVAMGRRFAEAAEDLDTLASFA
ncbi:phosphotransferase family protein [Mycobacterium sp. LTG2003]